MKKLTLEIPDEVLISLKETPQEFSKSILTLSAVKLYEMGKLSSGRAAQLAGMTRVQFLETLSDYGVAVFDLTSGELKDDMQNA